MSTSSYSQSPITRQKDPPATERVESRSSSRRIAPADAWLTPAEAGTYLKLTAKALEHLRARPGAGPRWYLISGRCRYRVSDLQLWAMSKEGGNV
jgi:hypothetical protein